MATESPKNPVRLMILVTSCQRMILTPAEEEDSATHEEDTVEAVPVNLLSKTVRTRTDRSCFHIVLFLHTEVQKAISFCRSL